MPSTTEPPAAPPASLLVPPARVRRGILRIRGHKVLLDADLADLYGVTTRRLNEQVKRNRERFPADFMFRLTREEKAEVVANCDHLRPLRFAPALPHAFTEHGTLMLASVLNSPAAVEVSIQIARVFVQLRRLRETRRSHRDLVRRLEAIEERYDAQDGQIQEIFAAIRALMAPPAAPSRRIGFRPDRDRAGRP